MVFRKRRRRKDYDKFITAITNTCDLHVHRFNSIANYWNLFKIEPKTIFSVIFSTATVVFLIVFVIRWLGNKGMGQLKTIELIIILGLSEAIGQSMLNPSGTSIP